MIASCPLQEPNFLSDMLWYFMTLRDMIWHRVAFCDNFWQSFCWNRMTAVNTKQPIFAVPHYDARWRSMTTLSPDDRLLWHFMALYHILRHRVTPFDTLGYTIWYFRIHHWHSGCVPVTHTAPRVTTSDTLLRFCEILSQSVIQYDNSPVWHFTDTSMTNGSGVSQYN